VEEVVKNDTIRFLWDAANPRKNGEPYKTTVEFTFKEIGPSNTLVTISEWGWEESDTGYLDSRGNSQGWMNMLTCMKAFVEHGINLRAGMFK